MNEEEYKRLYLGEFTPIDEALYNKIEEYFINTPDSMDNRTAFPYWVEVKKWCFDNGYTQKEITRAKTFLEPRRKNLN